ncbi:serine hydrolase domain-containing protein [Umezawaea sp. Da 62-37]|uniref:serine hydrolase domain-containing protein n=1 Tax=Umezawaea sp. Da 62-37 TaxID=3075927 RepID=UPI0028F7048C|nr:serine hydrolase domain-containing protein [Umezawaea sp. Da 62-37]WNV86318.1 serine hydrolase domain-containing protein [Umezawaea sp. Da 62-37]
MVDVSGSWDARFEPVKDALARQVESGNELGASVVVDVDGTTVVDIWAGWRDAEHTSPWTEDTITNVWSTTKTVTNLSALVLVDRGLLDPYAPVAKYWPEFAENGKERVEVRHLLGHTSGVSGWETPFAVEDMYDWDTATKRLAAQKPWWEPGTASGYHASNQGHLVGEVVRRVSGKPLKAFVAEEIAGPLGADFQIGARESDWDRIAPVVPPPPLPFDLAALDPESPMVKTFSAPATDASAANTPDWRRADMGAVNGHGNARSVARILKSLSLGGTVDGVRLLSPDTIDVIFDEQSNGVDLVLGVPLRFGVGFALPETQTVPYAPQGRACYWGGWGGSVIMMDLDRRVTISYMMNRMAPGIIGSDRSQDYVETTYACLD